MAYRPNDPWARKARREHFVARSVYKLEALQEKYDLLRPGHQVLDLGCSPGSWSQYASQAIGPKGRLLGIDLTAMTFNLPNAHFVQADLFSANVGQLAFAAGLRLPLDVVLSDMAPKTTGSRVTDQARSAALCEEALRLALQLLRPGGHFVCKMFEGPDTQAFRAELQQHFAEVRQTRPPAVQKNSKEIFWVARQRRAPADAPAAEQSPATGGLG